MGSPASTSLVQLSQEHGPVSPSRFITATVSLRGPAGQNVTAATTDKRYHNGGYRLVKSILLPPSPERNVIQTHADLTAARRCILCYELVIGCNLMVCKSAVVSVFHLQPRAVLNIMEASEENSNQ